MFSSIPSIFTDTSAGFVLAALVICLVGSWLLVGLLRRAAKTHGVDQAWWLASVAIVGGVTVWTTHFLAMLGYRPDLMLTFAHVRTLLSIAVSILAVGIPLAATTIFTRPALRIVLGAIAGLGIGTMHFVGMSAIEGCLQSQSLSAALLGCLGGALCYALAMALTGRFQTRWVKTVLFTAGVAFTHFVSISGVTLEPLPGAGASHHLNAMLSLMTAGGALSLFVGAFMSLVASKRFQMQEHAHATILATALDNMSNGLIFVGRDGLLRLYNDRFLQLFQLERTQVHRGMTMPRLIDVLGEANGWDSAERSRVVRRMDERMQLTASETVEYGFDDGRILEIVSGPVEGGIVLTFNDKTSERQSQSRIAHMAYHDPLTGLANRRSLQERMEDGFAPKRRYKLMLIDLDRFKAVNDTFGHKVGDQLLVAVAERLRVVSGQEGFVARFGGDEMAVLVYGDLELAMAVARNINDIIRQPFAIDGTTLAIGCSIGMCCTDDADSVEELIQRADVALYEAKRRGRGGTSCYQPGMLEAVAERHQLESDIQTAIDEKQFHLVYQPVMSLQDERIIGYEALIRWQHPSRGLVPPSAFIPVAEETGQIVLIGQWVIEEACREAASWASDRHVAVNVSPVQFRSPMLQAQVIAALAKSGLAPQRLEIELTETALVQDGAAIAHILANLRGLGIKVAMDDFGTGYSSLAHLRDFPIDRIKIDRSFVMSATSDRHSMAVVKAVTQLGRDMDVPTLAEGVETEEQLKLLRDLGCNDVQGYLIGKPALLATTEDEHGRLSA